MTNKLALMPLTPSPLQGGGGTQTAPPVLPLLPVGEENGMDASHP